MGYIVDAVELYSDESNWIDADCFFVEGRFFVDTEEKEHIGEFNFSVASPKWLQHLLNKYSYHSPSLKPMTVHVHGEPYSVIFPRGCIVALDFNKDYVTAVLEKTVNLASVSYDKDVSASRHEHVWSSLSISFPDGALAGAWKNHVIDCKKIRSAGEFWDLYLRVVKPQGAGIFGRNLDAFWDACSLAGPGWPGPTRITIINTKGLREHREGFLAKLQGLVSEINSSTDVSIRLD
ncbi:hypothetical protein ACFL2Q_02520 [Thermodesulfobacteriota bacterium]